MRLTNYTNHAIRVLLYLGIQPPGTLSTIANISRTYGISRNHVMKVVSQLVNAGFLRSVRGRLGGVHLARAPETIRIGEVVRHTEQGFGPICPDNSTDPAETGVNRIVREALDDFLQALDRHSLADLLAERRDFD